MGEKKGFFSRLVSGLTKTRDNIVSGIDAVFGGFSQIDEDFYEEIEEILIMGDIGVSATENILESLKQKVKENHIKKPDECKELLIESIKEQMQVGETAYRFEEEKSGKESGTCGGGYIPRGGRRTVKRMGEPCRRGHDRRPGGKRPGGSHL